MEDTMNMSVAKDGAILMQHELSLGLKSRQMLDIPMLSQRMYEVTVSTPSRQRQ
jgi:hypothetical protein